MTNKITKLYELLQKALPENAVYVSEEEPTEGTQIFDGGAFGGRKGTQIWFRTPEQSTIAKPLPDFEEPIELPPESKVQQAYLADTARKGVQQYPAFQEKMNDPSTS